MRTDYFPFEEWVYILRLLQPIDRIITKISLHTGLRISDILEIKKNKFKKRMTIHEKKTGKKKDIYLPERLYTEALQFIKTDNEYLFPAAKGTGHRSRQAIYYDFKRASEALRLKGNLAPHSARKYYAVAKYRKWNDIRRVQKKLLHENIATTTLYVFSDKMREGETNE